VGEAAAAAVAAVVGEEAAVAAVVGVEAAAVEAAAVEAVAVAEDFPRPKGSCRSQRHR
jgi:hypothetical protein